MKEREEHSELDELIRLKLSQIQPEFEEAAWKAMEAKLDKATGFSTTNTGVNGKEILFSKKNLLLSLVSLIFINLIVFYDYPVSKTNKSQINSSQNIQRSDSSKSIQRPNQKPDKLSDNKSSLEFIHQKEQKAVISKNKTENTQNTKAYPNKTLVQKKLHNEDKAKETTALKMEGYYTKNYPVLLDSSQILDKETNYQQQLQTKNVSEKSPAKDEHTLKKSPEIALIEYLEPKIPASFFKTDIQSRNFALQSDRVPEAKKAKYRLGLSIIPEINAFQLAEKRTFSLTLALQNEFRISDKFRLNFGFLYAQRSYKIQQFPDISSPQSNALQSIKLDASFSSALILKESTEISSKMLEIPVELKYLFFQKTKTRFFAGAGFSNYVYLYQKFSYDYTSTSSPASGSLTENNKLSIEESKNKFYPAGTLNFGLGLEQTLGKKINFQLQAIAKLPLNGIGLEKASLHTLGLRMGLLYAF